MSTDFQDRLRQIREAKDRESEEKRASDSAETLDRLQETTSRFDRRERVEAVIEAFVGSFLEEVPGFSRSKSFFEGNYKIELSCDDVLLDEGGRVVKNFSRFTFLLDPKPEIESAPNAILLRCKKTVRNWDLESTQEVVEDAAESVSALEAFVQAQLFEFAGQYFSDAPHASAS